MNTFLSPNKLKPRLKLNIRLGIGLLLLMLLQSAVSFAQKITLNYQNTPLEQVLKEIRKQSGYDIFFDQTLVSQQPPVAVKISNANVEEAMAATLKGLPLSFSVNGKAISIKKPAKEAVSLQRQQGITLSSMVVDENDEPISGVSVSSGTLKAVYTDARGKFTLNQVAPLAIVRIAYTGRRTIELNALAISLLGQIRMETQSINLNTTIIQGQKQAAAVTKVELQHRRQLSLAQALEGTIPGLVIKGQKSTEYSQLYIADGTTALPPGTYTRKQMFDKITELVGWFASPAVVQEVVEITFRNGQANGKVSTTMTTTDRGVIPELRGAGGFGAGNNGILVVIDGFVQENFPAEYSLNNVLSLEVIRDPAETIKWGPRAANGVVIITTFGGKAGELQISYNSNFNFSDRTDNSMAALQTANTAQVLDYTLEENKFYSPFPNERPNLSTASLPLAKLLVERLYRKEISQTQFDNAWSALSKLSNEGQYRGLQQRAFNQVQNLNLSGGSKYNRFSINGSYSTSRTESLGNHKRSWGINFRDQLSLLDNKLQVALQVNANFDRAVAGKALSTTELQPYQLLYNPDGSYIYDYSLKSVSELKNIELKQKYPGLLDYGYNPLEEARGTTNTTKSHLLNSSLNLVWKLLEGLNWSANLQYIENKNNGENLWTRNTQYARNLYNSYYAVATVNNTGLFPIPTPLNPPTAFAPYGNIFQTSQNRGNSTNFRTGFTFSRVFNEKHALELGLGVSAFKQLTHSSSDLPIYAYDPSTGASSAPNLSFPTSTNMAYRNPLGVTLLFNNLTSVTPSNRRLDRNLSASARIDYVYDKRLGINAFYNEGFMPINSANIYSSTRNYNTMASWTVHNESFFKFPLISKLKLSAGFGEIKMASLPVNLPAIETFDPNWGSYLEVTGYNTVRQNGEQIRNYDALLDLGLFKDVLQGQFNYRYNSMGVKSQLSGRLSYHISNTSYFKVPFVSNLIIEGLVSNISPAQALAQMMSTNSPLTGGGYSMATANFNLGSLPPHITNREISLRFSLWKDRLSTDARYYNRSTSGLSNGTFQSDLSTGFGERSLFSRIDNKGYELFIQAKILQGRDFTWTSTVNAAHNINQAKEVIQPLFELSEAYFRADRPGYASGSLWSFRWAGLDSKGQPQIYDANGTKRNVVAPTPNEKNPAYIDLSGNGDASLLEYSGNTTPPWSGAFIQEFGYKSFYARATLRFALGHVMRTYRPAMEVYSMENSSLIAKRWRKPGDEAFTDIPTFSSTFSGGRAAILQNSSNSVAPADFFKLSELQFGYDVPRHWLKGKHIRSINLAINLQNVGLWTRNKLGIDPEAILPSGQLLVRQPMRYSLALNVGF